MFLGDGNDQDDRLALLERQYKLLSTEDKLKFLELIFDIYQREIRDNQKHDADPLQIKRS